VRTISDFTVGPEIKGNTAGPLNCIKTYLAKKDEEFYKLKVLTIENPDDSKQTKEVVQVSLSHLHFSSFSSIFVSFLHRERC
jgi:hypothetical protein